VYSAEQQNQKEKFEVDLKKEIKKLQRLRDQIKTWIGSSDVKDKDTLLQTRKLIETKMEQFKICEKETKTKTYSKEGLARAEKLSPEEQAKHDTCEWVGNVVKQLGEFVDEKDLEIERLSTGKGKKTNRHIIDEYNEVINSHKFHINKLEGIMRLVMNDRLDQQLVDDLKEEIEYYAESHEEEEYMQSYDEEYFYESLGLDELDVVNVDRVTQASNSVKTTKKDDESATTNSSKETKKSKKAASNMIPMTIGRARVKKDKKNKKEQDDDEKSHDSSTPTKKPNPSLSGPSPTAPAARPPPPVNVNGGASMAAILKRESEQQEKERQKQAALQAAQQQVSLWSILYNANHRFTHPTYFLTIA
jgi:CCR4-NOT transcription complex subunit 3